MNIKKVLIVWGVLAFCHCVLAQSEADKAKMDQEDLVPGVAVMNGGAEIKGYLKSISSSQNGRRYDQMWDLQDNKIKFLPRDTFERYDKIKRSMYLELTPETCEKYVYDGKYEVLSLRDRAQPKINLFSKKDKEEQTDDDRFKRVFIRYLRMDNFGLFARYHAPKQVSAFSKEKDTFVPISPFAAVESPTLYCYCSETLIPLTEMKMSHFSSGVIERDNAGKYDHARTAEENIKYIGVSRVFGDRRVDKVLNALADRDGKSPLSHPTFGLPAPHSPVSDSIIVAMHANTPHKFTILGVDEPDANTLRVATATVLTSNHYNIFDLPYEIAIRAAYAEDETIMIQISTYDKQSRQCTSTYETLFYANGESVTDAERSIDDLVAMYPTLLKDDMPNFKTGEIEWQFNPLYQSYFVKPKKEVVKQEKPAEPVTIFNIGSAFKSIGKDVKEAVSDTKETLSYGRISHPTRTDKYAKYQFRDVRDPDAGLIVTIYPDEPTKQKENADLYGYEVIMTDYYGNINSQKKFDFEFSKKYKESVPITDTEGNVIGQLLVFETRSIKKQNNDLEQAINFITVMYDGSEPYQARAAETRKYDKGNTFFSGAYVIDGSLYALYESNTKGEADGKKEKLEKAGFLKIMPDGTTVDNGFVSTDELKDIKTRLGNDDRDVVASRNKSVGSLRENANFYIGDDFKLVKILQGDTKTFVIGYVIRDKEEPLEVKMKEGYRPTKLYAEIAVFTCDKKTMALEQITAINEGATEFERPIVFIDQKGDNFSFVSSRLTDEKGIKPYVINNDTFGHERYGDASNILSEAHVVTFENGKAAGMQNINARLFGNKPVVKCADGSVYFLAIRKGVKVLPNDRYDKIGEDDKRYFSAGINDESKLFNLVYLDFKKM